MGDGDRYDLVVMGSGTGGYAAALLPRPARQARGPGRARRPAGRDLPAPRLHPVEGLLESASVMDRVNRSEEWGIQASGEVDWPKVLEAEQHIADKKV